MSNDPSRPSGDSTGNTGNIPDLGYLARFFDRLDKLGIDPRRLCSYLLYAGGTGDRVPASAIASEFDVAEGAASQLLDWLAGLGGVWFPSGMEDAVRVDRQAMSGLLAFIERLSSAMTSRQQMVLADDQLDTIEMTTAMPFDPEEGDSDLMPRLASIVTGAEEQLILVTPFFNRFAVDTFVDRVVAAAEDGVTVTVVTRDTDTGDNATAVDRIHDAVADADAMTNLKIFDYGAEDQRLHAKALVADKEIAYVGSANMTSYSLQEAIEMGVIIEGPTAATVADFFRSLQSAPATERIQ